MSTVQDYSDRFNAVLCQARNLFAPQKVLFVGGLPKHIKVDVELREPQDLQTTMYLARAFECRAAATLLVHVQQTTSPPQRQPLALPAPAAQARALDPAATIPPLPAPQQALALAPFRRLTPAKMLERVVRDCASTAISHTCAATNASGFSSLKLMISSLTQ